MDEQDLVYLRNYIGGSFVEHSGQDWMDVLEPATGRVYGKVPLSGSETIDARSRLLVRLNQDGVRLVRMTGLIGWTR